MGPFTAGTEPTSRDVPYSVAVREMSEGHELRYQPRNASGRPGQ
jgi:hypothetical protein